MTKANVLSAQTITEKEKRKPSDRDSLRHNRDWELIADVLHLARQLTDTPHPVKVKGVN